MRGVNCVTRLIQQWESTDNETDNFWVDWILSLSYVTFSLLFLALSREKRNCERKKGDQSHESCSFPIRGCEFRVSTRFFWSTLVFKLLDRIYTLIWALIFRLTSIFSQFLANGKLTRNRPHLPVFSRLLFCFIFLSLWFCFLQLDQSIQKKNGGAKSFFSTKHKVILDLV